MAIAFDAATDGGNNGGTTSSHTFSHTCTGSDRLLLVALAGDTTDIITGVTYAGVAMTLAGKVQGSGQRWQYLFYLLNPASGANNVVSSSSGNCYHIVGAASYTGVGLFGNSVTVQGGSSTSQTASLRTPIDNAWTFLAQGGYNANNPPSAGTGSTRRTYDAAFGTWGLFDSNGPITPAVTTTSMTVTRTSASTTGTIMVSFGPVGGTLVPLPLLLESWEAYGGDSTQAGRNWSGSPTPTTNHVKTGTYSFGGVAGNAHSRALTIAAASVTFGMHVYWTTATQPSQGGVLLGFLSGASYDGFNDVCALNINTDGTLRVTRRFNSGTTLGTSAACLNNGAFNYIEATFTFGAAGGYLVKCNGSTVLNASGDMGGTTINGIHIGAQGAATYALDNLWIMEGTTLLGEQIISAFFPTGDGANTGLTPSTGTSHYALVDEAVANDDTDYNAGGSAGVKDTYTFDTSALAGFTINVAQLSMCAKATAGGTNTIAAVTRIGGSDYDGATQAITTSYDYYQQVWGSRPSDSGAWTQSDVGEFGMKAVATAGANRLTQAVLEVLSSPTASFVPVPLFIHHYKQQGIM